MGDSSGSDMDISSDDEPKQEQLVSSQITYVTPTQIDNLDK